MPEALLHRREGRACVFNGVMQQGGDDGGVVQALLGQKARHFDGMREIGIPGCADLPLMRRGTVIIGVGQKLRV